MGSDTKIQWTGSTWTAIRARHHKTGKVGWHCVKVSDGCTHCYSKELNGRLGTGEQYNASADVEIFLDRKMLQWPLHWKKPRKIFVCSMTDLFADFVPDEYIDQIFAVMALTPQHTYQVLSKRPLRMKDYITSAYPRIVTLLGESRTGDVLRTENTRFGSSSRQQASSEGLAASEDPSDRSGRVGDAPTTGSRDDGQGHCGEIRDEKQGGISDLRRSDLEACLVWPLPNVWLGVSCEDQATADERIPLLLQTPAAVRFVSLEPILGPIELAMICSCSAGMHRPDGSITRGNWHHFGCFWYDPNHKTNGFRSKGGLDWVIVGGESGPDARPFEIDWAIDILAQCRAAGVPAFFKQAGANAWYKGDRLVTRDRKGGDINEFPDDLRIREFPK